MTGAFTRRYGDRDTLEEAKESAKADGHDWQKLPRPFREGYMFRADREMNETKETFDEFVGNARSRTKRADFSK